LTGIAIPGIVKPKIVLEITISPTLLEILNLILTTGQMDGTMKLMEIGTVGQTMAMETGQEQVILKDILGKAGERLMEALEVQAVMVQVT